MKSKALIFSSAVFFLGVATAESSVAQKIISEGTLQYKVSSSQSIQNSAAYSVFLKGGYCRTELVSSAGTESYLHDPKTGEAACLREISDQKLMIVYKREDWNKRLQTYDSTFFVNTAESKTILNYPCKKATTTLGDQTIVTVFYTEALIPGNKEYEPIFKNLDGLPMEYSFEKEGKTFTYSLLAINFDPVLASRFEWPKSGYRLLPYADTKKNQE